MTRLTLKEKHYCTIIRNTLVTIKVGFCFGFLPAAICCAGLAVFGCYQLQQYADRNTDLTW